MKFAIKHSNGTTFYEGKPKYNGIFGKPSYIEFSEIASDKPIAFAIGDYVDYSRTGFRYRLYSIPQVDKSATKQTHGSAFVYKNVQFYAATKDLELALFRDLVMYDNTVHFSSIPNVDTYEDVYGIARRIQANLDSQYPNEWTINVISSTSLPILSEVRQFSVSDGTCLDALNEIYNLWKGIGWIYSVVNGKNTITIGKPNIQTGDITTDIFAYGHDNGLKVIGKAVSSKADFATRVYAYGSDRNMPTRYYNNLSANIKDKESIYVPHLMLPLTDWRKTGVQYDASKAYLDSGASKVIPKILRFDGSGDLPDIYPSIEGVSRSGYRIDEVYTAYSPLDDGMFTDDSKKVIAKSKETIEAQEYERYIQPYQRSVTCGFAPILELDGYARKGKCGIEFGGTVVYIDGLGDYAKGAPVVKMIVNEGTDAVLTRDFQTRWISDDRLECPLTSVEFMCETNYSDITVSIRVEINVAYTPGYDSEGETGRTFTYGIEENESVVAIEHAIESTFTLVIRDPGFDISQLGTTLSDGLATLSMKDGMCAGREFVIKKCEQDEITGRYTLTLQRQEDTSLSLWFPNSSYPIASGDHFVLLDMQMPSSYVEIAEERLHDAASEALQRLSKPKMTYTPTVDSKAVYVSEITLLEGMYMPVYDTDLIGTEISTSPNTTWVLIDSMTIAENEDAIPIWSVTLRDEKEESVIQRITGEVTQGNRFIKKLQDEGKRKPVTDGIGENDPNARPKTYIEAESLFFVYDDRQQLISSDTILLTAITEGISDPYYQWYYLGAEDWEALEEETEQTLSVIADSEIYFQNDELVEDFKVVVSDGDSEDASTYESVVRIAKVKSGNGYMVSLNNPAHIFPATEDHAEESSDTVTVLAYKGQTAVDVTIGTITGDGDGIPDGMTVASGGVAMARTITVSVDEDLTQGSGLLYIPVTVVEVQTDEEAEGEETDPEPPSAFSVTLVYSWALAFQGSQGEPGSPGEDGDDGYSSATIYLYQRFPTGTPSQKTISATTYNFATDTLTGSNLNGWTRDIPSGNGAVYVTTAHVSSNAETASITAGWKPNGGWTLPSRLTGEDGRMGKIMRGVNVWTSSFTPSGGWQGINDVNGSFYDVVERSGGYYYLTDGSKGNQDPLTSPYWVAATNFDFIATKVLLAEDAFIDILGGNAIYMYGNDGSASGQVVAGIQGGSSDVDGDPQVNFFAGDGNPQDAPFRVYYDGTMVANKGRFGNLTINSYYGWGSIISEYTDSANIERKLILDPRQFSIESYDASTRKHGGVTITPNDLLVTFDVPAPVYVRDYSLFENGMAVYGILDAERICVTNFDTHHSEDVVTSPDGALRITIVTDDYPETLADNTIYIKVQ